MATLKDDGYSEHLSFLTSEEINTLEDDINRFIRDHDVYNIPIKTRHSFKGLRRNKSTTINRRFRKRDGDEGLIDVFNVDRSLQESSREILRRVQQHCLDCLGKEFPGSSYKLVTNNLYINRSVTHTRGIHADSGDGGNQPTRHKSFLFLTDVPDESYGPFSYIARTHLGDGTRYHRKYGIYNPLGPVHKENYKIFIGIKKGDVLIASVAGAHRGLPQEEGRLRLVLVSSYDP